MKLRIISGILKGRLITVPKSDLVRPTTDRVRETLFNILNNKIDFEGVKVLDLYAGSGSLGLECLSRGASEVQFVEQDLQIIKNLEKNLISLKIKNQCTLYKMSVLKFVDQKVIDRYHLILADPPFFKDDIYKVVEIIMNKGYLAEGAMMIIERSIKTKEKDIENFKTEPFKVIGDNCLFEISH